MKSLVDRFPTIAKLYRAVRDLTGFMKNPVLTSWGFMLSGKPSMAKGTFEPVETEIVRNLLDGVDVLNNVGANVGYYCCHALSMEKHAIAFEPVQRNL